MNFHVINQTSPASILKYVMQAVDPNYTLLSDFVFDILDGMFMNRL